MSVFPLEFIALTEIDRKIFGNKCNHVNVSEGLLIVGYGSASNGTIQLYNFRQLIKDGILYKAELNKPCQEFDGQVVGCYPAGLPLNCKIRTAPPILFEVKCSDFNLHIGGHPWHYVTTPPRREGVFQICSLADHTMAENGCLDFPNVSTEADSVAFHSDDSGRLVYHAAHSIRFYKLNENTNGSMSLTECLTIDLEENEKIVRETFSQRRTQRIIKKKFNLDAIMACEKSILSDDYENELDVYAVAGFAPGDDLHNGKIVLYDNETGHKIKTVRLDMKMDELSDYTLTMDLETFILLVKNKISQYSCYIYRLESLPGKNAPRGKGKKSHQRTS
ncbi:DDB1- and CUL4-associated factor 17-like [Centruroides sculpturatus]|uniref:DDB1- and CUL4-associated factor 17-like n=1 Tax=Centruroides sculpturatus TaxID=218467 RepID=UPI000C6CFEE0|nr:DDB1- and CUL4-associated factor 17-like [Centruroides sculpturatus]XP_023225443.1 DDB1- and CUL4-associated factor 17-like [Centruroides sculpturatus]XP_023225445.1 DDB1- and CUL4-associated factor 17-like [Centruroides sculpturatus]XP_023225446.1 DDB1- and CUL4-associated factor 17-like [Centruroides sculpturatus]